MKRFIVLLLIVLPFVLACSPAIDSSPEMMTPSEFTHSFANDMVMVGQGIKVEVAGELQLTITAADGSNSTVFLFNAYDTYKADPAALDDIVKQFVASSLETALSGEHEIDRTRIVPIIRHRSWPADMRDALVNYGNKQTELVFEEFNDDLVIAYAEDTPTSIRYLSQADLKSMNVAVAELRAHSCANLERLVPKIERHGESGVYMVTAGGTYESSLLLLDSIWAEIQGEVEGDVVVAIPTRDLLMVTGSADRQGIQRVKQIVNTTEGPYHLSNRLFVRRNGRFDVFEDDANR